MKCPNCGASDFRWFEHIEKHRVIEKEEGDTIYLSRLFSQDDEVVQAFFECLTCNEVLSEDALATMGLKVVPIED